jgi:hypothetical protein
MRIVVTQEDIDGATRAARNCPIARAVKRITGHPYAVTASPFAICLHTEDGRDSVKRYKPTRRAVEFMGRFDDGLGVKPSVYTCPDWPE